MEKKLSVLRKEYMGFGLDENTVHSDPFRQFHAWFDEALKSEVEEPNAMVLATSGVTGRVSARVVLLKGVEHSSFLFFTHYGSRKGLQIKENRWAALNFHWKEISRQIRIEGEVIRISRQESVRYFSERPLESRISAVVSAQSQVIPDRIFLEAIRTGYLNDLQGQSPECPDDWGGYRLKPDLFEFWQGREYRLHDRIQYRKKRKGWLIERLAP